MKNWFNNRHTSKSNFATESKGSNMHKPGHRVKGASYKIGSDIDESDFESLNTGFNVQDINKIESDKKGQFITSKTGKDNPYANSKKQDTIRPSKGKYFKMGWGDSDDTDQDLYGKGGYIPEDGSDISEKLKKKKI